MSLGGRIRAVEADVGEFLDVVGVRHLPRGQAPGDGRSYVRKAVDRVFGIRRLRLGVGLVSFVIQVLLI